MTSTDLLSLISSGENSRVQLKENLTNAVSVAQEMVAFANTKGGTLIIGVNKNEEVKGLSFQALRRINHILVAAADCVRNQLFITTETVDVAGKKVLVATIPEGIDKPYVDGDGLVFVKDGTDKRKVTSEPEIRRLLQENGNLYADKEPVRNSSIKDLDWGLFREFYEKKYKEEAEFEKFPDLLESLSLAKGGQINLTANLLFGKRTQILSPSCYVTAIWFVGNDLAGDKYLSSENIGGDMARMFKDTRHFIMSCLRKQQNGQNFNSLGEPEIPQVVIDELLINAIIHRDYFIQDSIKALVFDNRVEIRSPGKLPNSLTVREIRHGVSRRRNHLLSSYAFDVLPYRGTGSGILRALQAYPNIEFVNWEEAEQFTAIIHRPTT